MKKILLFTTLTLVVIALSIYFFNDKLVSIGEEKMQNISMCGNTFTTDVVLKDGVNVGQRIALLATEEYEKAITKEHTNCFFLKDRTHNAYLPLVVEEKTSEESNLKGKSIYLITLDGDKYIVDRQDNQVYNVNAMDGSTRNVIGDFRP